MLARAAGLLALTRAAPLFAAEVRWSGPPDCDRQHAVSTQVESIVGRSLASVEALDFDVTVTHDQDAWRLELVSDEHGTKGRRSLAGQSCGEVTDAAAVLIAMAIRGAGRAPDPEATASPAPDETVPEPTPTQGRSADFNLLSGALLGCVDNAFGTLRAGGCAGFELGSLSGEGQGVSNPHLGSALWEAARLELGGFYPLGHELSLTARVGVAIPFSRPEFVLDGNPVYRPSALGLRASVGVELLP